MNNYNAKDPEEVLIDKKKVQRMAFRITILERENSKTKAKIPKVMREEIQAIIEEEAKKCY